MNLGNILSFHLKDQTLHLEYEKGEATIDAVTPSLLRFFVPLGDSDFSYAVEEDISERVPVTAEEAEGDPRRVRLSTGILSVVAGPDFSLEFRDAKGVLLAATSTVSRTPREKYSPVWLAKMAEMYLAQLAAQQAAASDGGTGQSPSDLLSAEGHASDILPMQAAWGLQMESFSDERFYGLGDKTGFLNKAGYEYENWNTDEPKAHTEQFKTLYKSIPFLIVLRDAACTGWFFDCPWKSRLDLGKESPSYWLYEAAGGNADFYFFLGPDMPGVVSAYTKLTGRAPLPQLWTLGYHQSRWGYDTAERFEEVADRLRAERLPCDAIHFDIDYMDGYRVFTWDEAHLGPAGGVTESLAQKGFHSVPIIDPGVKKDPDYFMYREGMEKDFFAMSPEGGVYENTVWPGLSVFPDFGKAAVQSWWAAKEAQLLDMGFSGTWNDMNEPASFSGSLPDDIVFTEEDEAGRHPIPHSKIHNVYGHLMSKATFRGLRGAAGKRPFVITRACYSGTQKYSTVWTGDNMSLWMHLQMMIPQLCNLGLSGYALAGTDIGGFGGDTNPELLSRWIEAAIFSPLLRNHSCSGTNRQEPWLYGEETLSIYRKYLELRYQLLPYLYDLCRVCEETGLPVMRPLVLHYESDPEAANCNDEFLVGESLLCAPVLEQGMRRRLVYFPEGVWYDYWDGTRHEGGRWEMVEAPLDFLPLFVRKGGLLPTWEVQQYVGETDIDVLTLRAYGCEKDCPGVYVHFCDNGEDYAYREGELDSWRFIWDGETLKTEVLESGFGHPYREVKVDTVG